jgi:SAM-dependent methyltransferase
MSAPSARYAGAAQIVRFNWPWYALALGVNAAAAAGVASGCFSSRLLEVVSVGLIAADYWLVASLAASHYVYDLSPVARGAWLEEAPTAGVTRVGVFHAGHDEASQAIAARLPKAELAVYDFFDARGHTEASLLRARREGARDLRAVAIGHGPVPRPDATLDLACVVFAAHEIREDVARANFFREIRRVLAPGGRLLIVEHLRNVANFAAYGPGFFHFLPRSTWLRAFNDAGLKMTKEASCTVFVRVFVLERPR